MTELADSSICQMSEDGTIAGERLCDYPAAATNPAPPGLGRFAYRDSLDHLGRSRRRWFYRPPNQPWLTVAQPWGNRTATTSLPQAFQHLAALQMP